MAPVISSLTSAALLLHALLGCCWHHTHTCARSCPATLSADDSHAPGQTAACHCTGHPGQTGHEHPYPGTCNGPRCALDPSPVSKRPAVLLASFRPDGPAALPSAEPSAQRGSRPRADDAGIGAPSVRPHLLNRVLLL